MTALQGAPVRIKVAARLRVGLPCIPNEDQEEPGC